METLRPAQLAFTAVGASLTLDRIRTIERVVVLSLAPSSHWFWFDPAALEKPISTLPIFHRGSFNVLNRSRRERIVSV